MNSPSLREATEVFLHGCCPNTMFNLSDPQNTLVAKPKSTSSVCRSTFVTKTTSSFFTNTQFTNHESLPSLQESLARFKNAYPQYSDSKRIDQIRAKEYNHLSISNHVCLDYIGIGLFSHSELQNQDFSESQNSDFPFFSISCKSVNLKFALLHGTQGSQLESAVKKRIMSFLNFSENEYSMVFTANRSSAFKLLAESYPFQSSRKLLTVYDYESEAVDTMTNTSEKRGARVMSAEFSWPRLRIQSAKLKKTVVAKKKMKKKRGLFVFPLQSRMTGASYSYQWMSMAQENGWHVLLDACALGPKDMDSFALSLFRPDFLICSFYKVFGENPTGFACLLVKKTIVPFLESSVSTGIVSLIPVNKLFQSHENSSSSTKLDQDKSADIESENHKSTETVDVEIECRGLDHVDSLGLIQISSRTRYIINWLINALMKLQHPNTDDKISLVRIYGPRIKFDRGPALSFNVYDWKGEKIEPVLVQKLADRSNISLSHGFLHQIWFSDKYEEVKEKVIERRKSEESEMSGNKRKGKAGLGIAVVNAAFGFLADFEDAYRLWSFVARFLDADFVEKERWRYTALNQKTIEV